MYDGEMRAGKRHGQGRFVKPDGTKYEGSYVEDEACGKGRLILPDGTEYVGEFQAWDTNKKRISSGFFLIGFCVYQCCGFVTWIRMRMRILGSVPLSNGSGRGSGRPTDAEHCEKS
jgi:hypothetical protein